MNCFARTILSMAMITGLATAAHAQTAAKADPKAPAAAPAAAAKQAPAATPAAKPAPAPAAAKPAAPAAAAKLPAPTAAPVAPPQPPAMPSAPAEVAAMAKAAGNWRCTGVGFSPAGEMKMTATIKNKLDVDKWWVRTNFAETGGSKFKFEAFTTYDTASKKWTRVMVDNMGNHEVSTSEGAKDGKLTWTGASTGSMGTMPGRHYEDSTNPKELKMWGEYSFDKGKTFQKAYEVTCKR
jgi:type IV secretory pathway VirB10-like protein